MEGFSQTGRGRPPLNVRHFNGKEDFYRSWRMQQTRKSVAAPLPHLYVVGWLRLHDPGPVGRIPSANTKLAILVTYRSGIPGRLARLVASEKLRNSS